LNLAIRRSPMTLRDSVRDAEHRPSIERSGPDGERNVLGEETFRRMISAERKRTERSRNPFLLMLLDTGNCHGSEKNGKALDGIVSALLTFTRETDVAGWYKNRSIIGVMFTELVADDKTSILRTMLTRVSATLQNNLSFEQFDQISISFHLFPDDWDRDTSGRPSNPMLYPDLSRRTNAKQCLSGIKRTMDIVGSTLALIIFAPIFAIVALAIKVSSRGPVFFRQQRIGQYGKRFIFLKFRSMYIDSDPGVHQAYVTKLIAGQAERK